MTTDAKVPDRQFAFKRQQWWRQYARDPRVNGTKMKALDTVMWELRSSREYAEVGVRTIADTIGKVLSYTWRVLDDIEKLGHWKIERGQPSSAGDAGTRTRFYPRWDGVVRGQQHRSPPERERSGQPKRERGVPPQRGNGAFPSREGTDSNRIKSTNGTEEYDSRNWRVTDSNIDSSAAESQSTKQQPLNQTNASDVDIAKAIELEAQISRLTTRSAHEDWARNNKDKVQAMPNKMLIERVSNYYHTHKDSCAT